LTHRVLDVELLNQLTKTSLTRQIDIEQKDGELPNTFVPGRNLLFLSLAGIIAQQKGFTELVTGVSQTDFSGYPDCREDFIKSMQMTLNLAMETSLTIHTPLMHIDKEQTWESADQLGVFEYVRDNTLTCYNGIIGKGCGECPSCKLRQNGLEKYEQRRGE
jgi:7-cyano-7-deazaguanine synthase